MPYLTEPEPTRGVVRQMLPGILCLTAENAGPMTYHGTNTYILQEPDGLVVIDPGPDDSAHVDALCAATGSRVSHILVTHAHEDHFGAVRDFQARTGAPIASFNESSDERLTPDIKLFEGSEIGTLTAVHTPGHASDHLCFARSDKVVFTGDHVMGWCTTVVSPPPRGNMSAFFASIEKLIARDDRLYLPGHGPALPEPRAYMEEVLRRRLAREREIEDAVRRGMSDPLEISGSLYHKTHPVLKRAAERNVLSHLSKLVTEGRVRDDGRGGYLAS